MDELQIDNIDVGPKRDWIERIRPSNGGRGSKIIGQALCYDASHNLYSVVPNTISPSMIYSMEMGARALLDVWPFIHDRLLDIGCGNRPYSLLINSLVSRYIGIDLPAHFESSQSDLCMDGLNLPFRLESFETVLLTDALYKVTSPTHLFREANRVLKLDGHLVLMISNSTDVADNPIGANYTPDGLRLLAERNGFNIRLIRTKGNTLPFLFNRAIQAIYQLLDKDGKRLPAKMNGSLTNVSWYDRPMIYLQKMLLKITPRISARRQIKWGELESHPGVATKLNLGYLMVAKKVFGLNEFNCQPRKP